MLQVAAADRASNREKGTQTLDSSEMVLFPARHGIPACFASSHCLQQSLRNRITGAFSTLFSPSPLHHYLILSLTALEAELLLGNAARASAEGDLAKLRKELAAAAAASAVTANVSELQQAKDTLQVQLDSERRRLQQLDRDYVQLQQQEQLLLAKLASMVTAEKLKNNEHAAEIAELRQQLQLHQHNQGIVTAEGRSSQQLSRMASVERSLSEGELAQQVTSRCARSVSTSVSRPTFCASFIVLMLHVIACFLSLTPRQSFGTPMRGSLSSSEKDTLITELQAKVSDAPPCTLQGVCTSRITQVSSLYAELRASEEATAATVKRSLLNPLISSF